MAQEKPEVKYTGALDGSKSKVDLSTFDPVLWSRKRWEKAPLRLTFKAENRKQAEVWQKKLRSKIVELVGQYLQKLKQRGISVLLIEQKLTIAMAISDRALVMGHGSIVFQGTPDSLRADAYIRKEWLEV